MKFFLHNEKKQSEQTAHGGDGSLLLSIPHYILMDILTEDFSRPYRTNQYKVLRFLSSSVRFGSPGLIKLEAEINTVGTDLWRRAGDAPLYLHLYSGGCFLNGALHWIVHDTENCFVSMCCFDFGKERFQPFPGPSQFRGLPGQLQVEMMKMVVLKDGLSVSHHAASDMLEIWVMKDYAVQDSWTKDFVIEIPWLDNYPGLLYQPLMVLNNGESFMIVEMGSLLRISLRMVFGMENMVVGVVLLLFIVMRPSRKLNLVDLQIATYARPRDSRIKLIPKINLPKDPKIAFNVVNSCNGFLCLSEPITNDPIYVCNPILGEYITLPKCSSGKTVSSCAFGFSPVTDQYKVVRSFDNGDYHEVEIYTLGEGFWRNIGNNPYCIYNTSYDTFVNGALHWLGLCYRSPDLIQGFDFTSEQFQAVPGPLELFRGWKNYLRRLGVLQGCLSLCDFSDGDHADIWLMKDYGGSSRGDVHIYGITSMFRGIAHVPSLVSLGDVARGENLKEALGFLVSYMLGQKAS
ncbi:hypothetical protein C3L33_11805, partial [Rhododendron williamsianum]